MWYPGLRGHVEVHAARTSGRYEGRGLSRSEWEACVCFVVYGVSSPGLEVIVAIIVVLFSRHDGVERSRTSST